MEAQMTSAIVMQYKQLTNFWNAVSIFQLNSIKYLVLTFKMEMNVLLVPTFVRHWESA